MPEKDGFAWPASGTLSSFYPLIILAFSLLGGFYRPQIPVASAATERRRDPAERSQPGSGRFREIYALVEQNFADPVKPDKAIYKGAIPGMLRTLDPHSNFFDPKDYQALREEQKGTLLRRRHAGRRRATARPS